MIPCMRRWELWEDASGWVLIPDGDPSRVEASFLEGAKKTWECVARGYNDAMRQAYEHLGYGVYKPILRSDGSPHPDDEDDGYDGCS